MHLQNTLHALQYNGVYSFQCCLFGAGTPTFWGWFTWNFLGGWHFNFLTSFLSVLQLKIVLYPDQNITEHWCPRFYRFFCVVQGLAIFCRNPLRKLAKNKDIVNVHEYWMKSVRYGITVNQLLLATPYFAI